MTNLEKLKREIRALGSRDRAKLAARYFKIGKGQYGEGDIFLGVTVPEQRKIAGKYADLPLVDVVKLLHSREHEFRFSALTLLVSYYKRGDLARKKQIYEIYLANTKWINNWDLVDTSVWQIVGDHLKNMTSNESRLVLNKLAHSKDLWEKRIAVIATFAFIKDGQYKEAFCVAELLLHDGHDLIHKAVGWMLREVGKKCGHAVECKFLDKYHEEMPRTMLRYALEHFPKAQKKAYMNMEKKRK
jgi:3-methyladenine DNA glycosylase AlkD